MATSADRARIIGELTAGNPRMADLLADLEADDELRARFEMELLRGGSDLDAFPPDIPRHL